jgi:tyrosine-protein phosphatase YwqE
MSRKLNDIEEFYVLQHLHLDDVKEESYNISFDLYNRGYEINIEVPSRASKEEIEANLAAMLNVINTGQLREMLTYNIVNTFGEDSEESMGFALNLINRWMAMEQAQYQSEEEAPVVPPHEVLNGPMS